MVYPLTSTFVSSLEHRKRNAVVSARVTDEAKVRAEVLSRHADAHSVSEYLGIAVETFLAKEQRRFGLSDEEVNARWEQIKAKKNTAPKAEERQGRFRKG